jgi:hypothetical protein
MKTLWSQTFWKILVKAWRTLLGPHNQNFGWYGVTRPQIEATAEEFSPAERGDSPSDNLTQGSLLTYQQTWTAIPPVSGLLTTPSPCMLSCSYAPPVCFQLFYFKVIADPVLLSRRNTQAFEGGAPGAETVQFRERYVCGLSRLAVVEPILGG